MKKRNLAFTVELLGLFILLLLVITVITQVFVMSRSHSLEAKRLTEAVILAENAAEAASAEEDISALSDSLAGQDNLLETQGTVLARINDEDHAALSYAAAFDQDSEDYYIVDIIRTYNRSGKDGTLCEDTVNVYAPVGADAEASDVMIPESLVREAEPVYSLSTAAYFGSVTSSAASGSSDDQDASDDMTTDAGVMVIP